MSKEKNNIIYDKAYDYLNNEIKPPEVDLTKYFLCDEWNTLEDVYIRFIASAQNYQMMPNVIKFYKREQEIKEILQDYDLKSIRNMPEEELYRNFRKVFGVNSKDSNRNCWRKWTRSVIDSAKFVGEFSDVNAFKEYINSKYDNDDSRMFLAWSISKQISGMGFALVCDALKELGYTKYSKPDVHMKEVFYSVGLSKNDEVSVCEAIEQMAKDCKEKHPGITAYQVDKVFWLICSGTFYKEGIKVKGRKRELIQRLKQVP